MRVWNCGKFENIEIGQVVTVFRCGSGLSTFGEKATLTRTTSQHLVFTTESGAIVKTKIDNIQHVVGKAAKDWAVSTRPYEDFEHMTHSKVMFWNEKKLCFEKK